MEEEATARCLAIWRHNALMGSCAFARQAMRQVGEAKTTSPIAKELAAKAEELIRVLEHEVRTVRVDPITGRIGPAHAGIDGGAGPVVQRDNTKDAP